MWKGKVKGNLQFFNFFVGSAPFTARAQVEDQLCSVFQLH